MNHLSSENEIYQLISHFANSFDLKEWSELENCFCESVFTDYSDLRGTPPETLSRSQFVALRKKALDPLRTHHIAGNREISVKGDQATARVSMVIFRKDAAGQVLNTHCLYLMGLVKQKAAWAINSIVQKVFWSDGNSNIHQGIQK
jgi:hypothetical protein